MSSATARTVLALLAGALGFFAGLLALLSATGLDRPGWAPTAMVAGAGLTGGAAAAGLARLSIGRVVAVAITTAVAGAVLGTILGELRDNYEWTIAGATVLVIVTSLIVPSLTTDTSGGDPSSSDTRTSERPHATSRRG